MAPGSVAMVLAAPRRRSAAAWKIALGVNHFRPAETLGLGLLGDGVDHV